MGQIRSVIAATGLRGLALLLIDDDIEQMNLCAAALKVFGASMLTAGSPADALSIMAQRAISDVDIDVVVVDHRMPAMNGCVLAGLIRARNRDLKIILFSGECDISEGEMSSVDAFVPKGTDVQALLAQPSELTAVAIYEVS
jgi:CheY-like chemotaxis protein